MAIGLLDADAERWVGALHVLGVLVKQFLAMSEEEQRGPESSRKLCGEDGLSGPCREHHDNSAFVSGQTGVDGVKRFFLIGPEHQALCRLGFRGHFILLAPGRLWWFAE